MLTLKQIYDDKAKVIAGLKKKHFSGAQEAIDEVLRLDGERKAAQQEKDAAAAQMNQISKSIGMLMARGQREEAEGDKANGQKPLERRPEHSKQRSRTTKRRWQQPKRLRPNCC